MIAMVKDAMILMLIVQVIFLAAIVRLLLSLLRIFGALNINEK